MSTQVQDERPSWAIGVLVLAFIFLAVLLLLGGQVSLKWPLSYPRASKQIGKLGTTGRKGVLIWESG